MTATVWAAASGSAGEANSPSTSLGRARPARQPAEKLRAARAGARQFHGQRLGHHQPLGMAIDDVPAARGSSAAEATRLTFTHACTRSPSALRSGDDGLQRVEVRPLRRQAVGARLEAVGEIGVAAAADLHQQRVEPAGPRRAHQRRDRLGRRETGARDPERAHFRRRLRLEDAGGGCQQRRRSRRNRSRTAGVRAAQDGAAKGKHHNIWRCSTVPGRSATCQRKLHRRS